jgi:hypothetical protein
VAPLRFSLESASVELDLRLTRRVRGARRRGLSGLGLALVAGGLFALAVARAAVPPWLPRLWPLALVAVGLIGVLRRPGWLDELDLRFGPEVARGLDRPRRIFSLALVGLGALCLLFTTGLVDTRVIGPGILIALGALLIWRRAR